MPPLPLTKRFAFWSIAILAAVYALGAAPARAESPSSIAGVMTRWQMSSKTGCQQTYDNAANEAECARSLMFSITPDLDGLTLKNWVDTLVARGVNTGVIYVMPSSKLATAQTIGTIKWAEYNQYIYLPPGALSDSQKKLILEVSEAISLRQYTVAQRNYAIFIFLMQLQSAFPKSTPMKFILDERVWFINHLNAQGVPITLSAAAVFANEQEYADDIAGILNSATSQNLDHWVSGVRLSEYASKDWNLMGPVMVDLVTLINAKTSGWLKRNIFIGAGGGWGQDWKGVNAMQCPTNKGWQFPACKGIFPFFALMNPQVNYFAFGDKFMEFGKPTEYLLNGADSGMTYMYITGEIADFCKENTRKYKCQNADTPSVADWQVFLTDDIDGLGLSDLVAFMQANAATYPRLTNVIFDGDSSDSIATMTLPVSFNGAVAMGNLFSGLKQGNFQNPATGAKILFANLGTWTGQDFPQRHG